MGLGDSMGSECLVSDCFSIDSTVRAGDCICIDMLHLLSAASFLKTIHNLKYKGYVASEMAAMIHQWDQWEICAFLRLQFIVTEQNGCFKESISLTQTLSETKHK